MIKGKGPLISRRLLLLGAWLAGTSSVVAQSRGGSDQGIGGTGITGGSDQGIGGTGIGRGNDHGIGGTGIVGVIQRFGSIVVNGQRIAYAADVPVRIDGMTVSAKALRVGQVARVLALRQANGTLVTHAINVTSEVAGPIESVRAGSITVLGQAVITSASASAHRVGTRVAVFGLRRTDGAIVASLVEPRHEGTAHVSGVLENGPAGLRIGGLQVSGLDAGLVGQRVQAEGLVSRGVMQVSRARVDDLSDLAAADHLVIEAYVRRVGSELQLGSGFIARGLPRFAPAGETRVVLNAVRETSGDLRLESAQSIGNFPGGSLQAPHGPNPDPGGIGPGGPGAPPGAPAGVPGGGGPPVGLGGSGGQPGGGPSPGTSPGPGPGPAPGPAPGPVPGPGGSPTFPGNIGPPGGLGPPGGPGGGPGPGGFGGRR